MVAFLEKSTGSAGFHQVIDFLNRSHIYYALTKNPAVSVSFIKQFWRSAEPSTDDNGEVKINTAIDGSDRGKTKETYRLQTTKLILRVKKLESQIKIGKTRRKARVVLLDDEVIEDDSSKQGRKLSDAEVQEKASTETELFVQEVTPTEVIQVQEGCGERVWDFNQNIEPMEHGTEKMKSPEKIKSPEESHEKMKSPEKIVEEEVDTQEEMKEVVQNQEAKEWRGILFLEKAHEETKRWSEMFIISQRAEVEEMFERIISKGRRLEDLVQKKLGDLKDNHKFRGGLIDQCVGSTSGIRACALRYFDLEEMELENSQNNALAKLPMLKLGEYEMWEIRIKQYFQIHDYALWEVIENGNSWVPIPVTASESGPSTSLKMTVPSTAEEKICKKNDVKARTRFGGKEATKRTQKALLKQQLAILGVVTPPEDLNVKFLRSLPSEWDTHVVVWMNKPDFDTMGLDDLYNNFKIVEQKVKKSTGAINDEKNLAFLTTSSLSITNTINTFNTRVSTGTTKVNTASTEISTANFSDATVYAFLSTQPQGSQLVHEDLEQLHDDDLEEIDLKWNMALLSMRARKFYQRTGRKIIIDGSTHQGERKQKLESSLIKAVRIEDASERANACYRWCRIYEVVTADEEIQANMALIHGNSQILRPTPLDLSYSGLEEFKELREEEPKKARENNDAPIIEDWVSDDEDEVEPIPKVEKKTVIPTATKKEFVKPEKPVRRSVSCPKTSHPSAHKHMAPRAVLMKTGLKTVNTARPVNTVRYVNTGRPFSTARSFNTIRPSYTAHPKSTVHCARPRTYFQNQAQSTVHRPFYKRTTLTNRCFNQRLNTGRQNINTGRQNVNTGIFSNDFADAQIKDKDRLQDENDATEKSYEDSSLEDNGTADQQVNTASPEVNTGSRECSAIYEGKTHKDLHTCLLACFPHSRRTKKGFLKLLVESSMGKSNARRKLLQFQTAKELKRRSMYVNLLVLNDPTNLIKSLKRGKIDQTIFIKRQQGHILLVQIYVDDIIFGSIKKELCDEFEKLMKDKFKMSSMGELTFFVDVKSASTPTGLEKPLVQDRDAVEVDEHLYRSMIGSLMYLTASRPDIMFAVCACKDYSIEIVAYTDSDYAGATQDRKSTTRGCQFLGNRLISWQCKKQTVVATSTTEAEYVAAANCCRQVLWIQN
ncbi:ribonuclease H-like domain-containing protein [Tanacetum coccineum]